MGTFSLHSAPGTLRLQYLLTAPLLQGVCVRSRSSLGERPLCEKGNQSFNSDGQGI